MAITANLINDNCTSLDEWTVEELGQWDVLEGNFHFLGVEISGAAYKEVASSGNQVTLEIELVLDTLTNGVQVFVSTPSASTGIEFKPTGVYENSTDEKICDVDLTQTIWRIQYDSSAQTIELFKDGVSQGVISDVVGYEPMSIIGFNPQENDDGHILYVKAGDGLGDFGGSPSPLTESGGIDSQLIRHFRRF